MNFKLTRQDLQTTGPLNRLLKYMEEGKGYIIEIKVAKDQRSLSQNEYYWAVVIPSFMNPTGYLKNEAHQELARMFLSYPRGNKTFTKSTTELNTVEFESYMEQCRLWLYHEFQIVVPKPNELTEEQLIELEKLNKY